MVKVTYADLRKEHSEQEVADQLLKRGYTKEQIMKNEFAYKKGQDLIDYPEKQTNGLQDFLLKHESAEIKEIGDSILRSAGGYKRAIGEGFNESNVGIMYNNKLPEEGSTDFTTGQQIVKGVTGVLSDSPIYFAGGAAGAAMGNPLVAGAGAFGLEDGVRSFLVKAYKNGEIKNFGDLVDRLDEFGWGDVGDIALDTAKGAVTGASVGKAGMLANKFSTQLNKALGLEGVAAKGVETAIDLASTTTTLVGANSILNLQVPTKDDFTEAAAVLLGLKGVHAIQNRILPKLPKPEGKPANDDFMADIDNTLNELKVTYNPNWQQEVVKDSGSRITYRINNKEFTQLQGDISGWLMDYWAKTGISPYAAVVEVKNNPAKIAEIAGYTPENYVIWSGKKLPIEYEVVEADTIKSSHDAEGNKNKDFPEYMQNRERDRKASQEQINNMATNFQPEFVTYSYDPQTGAPIITKDGYVIAGNGRFAATKLAQEKGTDGYYRDMAEKINPAAKDMKNPIIVRRLTNEYSEDEIRDMVQKSNQATTLRLSKSETAKDDASRIDNDLLDLLDTESELSSVDNRSFIDSALNKVIPENEKASLLDKDGKITNEGINRVNNALLAQVVSDNRMLSKLIETEDPVLKKVGNGLAKSAPAIVRMEKDIDDGRINESYSISENLENALDLYDKFKKSGQTLDDFLNQGDMFKETNPTEEVLLKIFQSSRGGNVIKDILNDYANTAAELSGGFDFGTEMTKTDILNEAYKRRTGKSFEFSNPENLIPTFDTTKPENYFVATKNGDLAHGYIKGIEGFEDGEVRVYNGFYSKANTVKPKEGATRSQQLAKDGYELIDFIDEVVNGYNKVYKGRNKESLLLIKTDKKNKGVAIKLEKNPTGHFYKVTSAYFVRADYLTNKDVLALKKVNPVEEAQAPRQHTLADQPRISDTGPETNIPLEKVEVKYNELNDEVKDLAYEGENPKSGLVKSDIYLGDKSMINVSYGGDIKAKPISKTDIADNFKKRFDVAYKKGKMYKKGTVRGFYRPNAEVIRTRGYDDFPVLVHETAHHLDKVLFGGNQTLTKEQKKVFASELKSIATNGDPFEEGFAEFVSYYVTNPEYVKKETPKFYKHFQEFMKENEPAILEVLDGAQKDWKAWREQPSDARIKGQISHRTRDAGISIPKVAHDFYTNYVDDLHPVKMLEKEALRARRKRNPNADMELKPSQSPYVLARVHRGVANKVANYIENKAFNTRLEETGESYKDVFGDLTREELDELNLYLIARRAMDLNLRGIETGIGQKDAVMTTKNLAPKWQERANRVYKYIDGLMQYAVDSGLVSEEAYIKMRKLDPHYVPFQREFPIDDRPTARKLSPNQVVKRIKGSDRRIIPVYETLLKETANIIVNSDKNVIMQKIAALAEMEGSGKYIERVESKKKVTLPNGASLIMPKEDNIIRSTTVEIVDPQTGNLITFGEMADEFWVRKAGDKRTEITVMRGGEPYVYEVSPEFANIANGLTPQDINVLWKIFSAPASTLRAGATLTPEFMIKNAIRDNIEAFINSRGLYIPFVDQAKGGYHLTRSDKELRDWQNAGGSLANFIPRDRASLQKRIKKINKNYDLVRSTGYVGAAWNQIKNVNPANIARLSSEAVEDSTRLGAYEVNKKYFNKQGYGEYDAKLAAAFESREATLDFARIGAEVRGLNAIIPFLNAGIQGTDKMARNIINHPVKTTAALSVVLLPSLYFYFANKGDKDIENLNSTIKDTNWITKIDGKMVKIPKPQNAIPFLTMFERTLESTPDTWWTNMNSGMADYLELNVWSNVPAALQPIVEKERNKTSYLGINLIPAEVENLMPEYQYTSASSETAKWLSKTLAKIGISNSYTSPIVIDQFVRDWTGGTGQYILNGLDYVATGKEKEDIYDYEHTPLFKAFRIAYPTRGNSQSYKDFMEKSEKLIKQYDTGKYLLKKDPQDMSYAFAQKYGFIKKYRSTVIELGKMLKAIQDNKTMSVQEKRQNADAINMRIIDLSKQGVQLIDTLGD